MPIFLWSTVNNQSFHPFPPCGRVKAPSGLSAGGSPSADSSLEGFLRFQRLSSFWLRLVWVFVS